MVDSLIVGWPAPVAVDHPNILSLETLCFRVPMSFLLFWNTTYSLCHFLYFLVPNYTFYSSVQATFDQKYSSSSKVCLLLVHVHQSYIVSF